MRKFSASSSILIVIIFSVTSLSFAKKYKNIKVLNDLSKKEIKMYMKSISKDLNVKCKFCHDMKDKAKDTKIKQIAREMMIMQNNLNKTFFSGEQAAQITCWTCHRGKTVPELSRLKK